MTHQPLQVIGITALADISAKRFVGFDGDLCALNTKALGVSELERATGRQASVITYGIALVEAGGAVAVGGAVTSDANGKAVDADVNPVNGYALDAAAADGDTIRIKVA